MNLTFFVCAYEAKKILSFRGFRASKKGVYGFLSVKKSIKRMVYDKNGNGNDNLDGGMSSNYPLE